MTVDEFPQAQVLGEGRGGHKDDADPVGISIGSPCFQAVFCSKTQIQRRPSGFFKDPQSRLSVDSGLGGLAPGWDSDCSITFIQGKGSC